MSNLQTFFFESDGLDYLHGTGHGVGHFLNVHEGPHGINSKPGAKNSTLPFLPGMTITDEPGYYENGKFGIRIESILIVHEAKTPNNFNGKKFYHFENITRVKKPATCDLSLTQH